MTDQQQNDSSEGGGIGGAGTSKTKPTFSPFPYGSPLQLQHQGGGAAGGLQTSFSGSPGQRLLLNSFSRSRRSPSNTATPNGDVTNPRLRGQDLYGGAVMFGGGSNSSFRRSRLMSASPYTAALRTRQTEKAAARSRTSMSGSRTSMSGGPPPSSLPSTASSSPSPSPSTDSMSSTARLILDTLDKMSTPILDARKIPTAPPIVQPRAEKRKLIEDELNCSLKSSPQRRRPRLGCGLGGSSLGGPPLRKNFSPVPSTPLSGALPLTPVTRLTPQPTILPTLPVQEVAKSAVYTPTAAKSSAGSSFKVKTKVTEVPGRIRANTDLTAPGPPPSPPPFSGSSVPQLQVDKLPVFNLPLHPPTSAPSPAPSTVQAVAAPKLNGVSIMEDSGEEGVEEPNNNKSSKKRSMEDNTSELPNKKTTEVSGGLTPEPPTATNSKGGLFAFKPQPPLPCDPVVEVPHHSSDKSSHHTSDKSRLTSNPVVDTPPPTSSPKFTFSLPQFVAGNVADARLSATSTYTFTVPSLVKKKAPTTDVVKAPSSDTLVNSFVSRVSSEVTNNLMRSSGHGMSSPKRVLNNISALPDVTNNLLKKSPSKDSFKGSSSRLPDITTSTGFGGLGPAKELKTGSVMDILGKKS